MRRWMVVLALVSAPVLAQDEAKKKEEGSVLPAGGLSRAERDAPAVCVRVREGGALVAKVGDAWKDVTLNELSALLKSFAEEQDREMQKSGKSAYQAIPGGLKVSRLFLSIEAEPTVPWQHIQWLMLVAAEQKYYKLEMSDGTRRILASLPVDVGLNGQPVDPPVQLKVAVHVVCRTEKVAKWGDLDVLRPAEIRYKIGTDETGDLQAVGDYVKKAWAAIKDTPNTRISGEIKAGHKVPFAKVFDVMQTFEAAGLPAVDFYGTAIPPPALREAQRLPYPLKNYDRTD